MRVSCFGSSRDTPSYLYEEMRLVGKLLALRGVSIATGAFGGIGMEAPCEGARDTGEAVPITGYSYGSIPTNPYINQLVSCQSLTEHIPFDAAYCLRLAGLLSSDAFIVAGGGGPGTFLELAATINFNHKFWNPMKRIAILEMRTSGGWDNALLDTLTGWGVLTVQVTSSIRVVASAEEAVRWVCGGI